MSRRICVRISLVLFLGATDLAPLAAGITPRPAAIDFGNRGHNESAKTTLELANGFPRAVQITRLKPSCGCVKLSPSSLIAPIAPGGSARVTVTMSSGRAFGQLTKYIEIDVAGDTGLLERLRVPVSMSVFDGYRMEPRELRFEGQFGGAPVTRSVLVTPKRMEPGRGLDLRFVRVTDRSRRLPDIGKLFRVTISDDPRGATIGVTLSPEHPEGRIWADVEALLDGKPLVIPLSGDMFRGILLSPRYFNFNRVEEKDEKTHVEEALLRAIDARAFEITGMTAHITRPKDPGFAVELKSHSRSGGREHVIRARVVTPEKYPAGTSFSGKVTVETTHPEKPRLEFGFFGFFAKPER